MGGSGRCVLQVCTSSSLRTAISGSSFHHVETVKEVNNKNLKNVIMQLRKVCQHPFLFHWPKDPRTREPVLGDELVTTSGKMMVLERLLDALFARGHKVLLFSQFTTMLDIIEDWAVEHKGWPISRIDGNMNMESRREDIRRFQEGGDAPDAPRLFLLSTRSGGLGLNLVQADTVIFYDQDWVRSLSFYGCHNPMLILIRDAPRCT